MEEYIKKSVLVKEIEKCYNECVKRAKITDGDYWYAKAVAHRDVLEILDNTLEVKDVDLDFMLHEYWNLSSKITIDCLESATMTKDEMINFAKHFFELGLKVQKGE